MHYRILCPSRLDKDPAIDALVKDYAGRLNAPLDIVHVKSKESTKDGVDHIKLKQAQALKDSLSKHNASCIIALDENGKNLSSLEFSKLIQSNIDEGRHQICFVIGGAHGLHQDILRLAHYRIALGQMTWPHRMVSAMLAEQIYRAQQINAGHPYHKL